MTRTATLAFLKAAGPPLLGALGAYLALGFPEVHAALCSGGL